MDDRRELQKFFTEGGEGVGRRNLGGGVHKGERASQGAQPMKKGKEVVSFQKSN